MNKNCEYKEGKETEKCAVENCNQYSNCALKIFFETLETERKNFSDAKNCELMNELLSKYQGAFKEQYSKSPGHGGRPTGKIFEDWVTSKLHVAFKKGNVDFKFGKFAVDAAIPNREEPKTLLEIKIGADKQHLLMFYGLLNGLQKAKPKTKIGLVTLYEINSNLAGIIKDLQDMYGISRFDYFHLQKGWSGEIDRLQNWCKKD